MLDTDQMIMLIQNHQTYIPEHIFSSYKTK